MDVSNRSALKKRLRTSSIRQLRAIFEEVAWTHEYDIIIDLIEHTDDAELIANVAKLDHRGVFKAVAAAEHASPEVLRDVFDRNDEDDAIQWRVLKNPKAPVDLLEAIAGSKDCTLRLVVAGNPNTSPETLRRFSKDKDCRVRSEVAVNPSTDYLTLESMQNDDDCVQWELAKNPHCPLHLLKAWSRSEVTFHYHARCTLAKVLKEELDAKAKAEGLGELSTASKLSIFDFGRWNWVILEYGDPSED